MTLDRDAITIVGKDPRKRIAKAIIDERGELPTASERLALAQQIGALEPAAARNILRLLRDTNASPVELVLEASSGFSEVAQPPSLHSLFDWIPNRYSARSSKPILPDSRGTKRIDDIVEVVTGVTPTDTFRAAYRNVAQAVVRMQREVSDGSGWQVMVLPKCAVLATLLVDAEKQRDPEVTAEEMTTWLFGTPQHSADNMNETYLEEVIGPMSEHYQGADFFERLVEVSEAGYYFGHQVHDGGIHTPRDVLANAFAQGLVSLDVMRSAKRLAAEHLHDLPPDTDYEVVNRSKYSVNMAIVATAVIEHSLDFTIDEVDVDEVVSRVHVAFEKTDATFVDVMLQLPDAAAANEFAYQRLLMAEGRVDRIQRGPAKAVAEIYQVLGGLTEVQPAG